MTQDNASDSVIPSTSSVASAELAGQMTQDNTPDYVIPQQYQFAKINAFRIGVCAFFDVRGHQIDARLHDGAPTLQDIIDKLPSFNTYGSESEITNSDELVDPQDLRIEPGVGLRKQVHWLTAEEEYVSGKHDAITIVCVEGENDHGEAVYAYFSVRLERLNAIYAWVRRGYLYTMPFGRRIKEGIGTRDPELRELMFDNWLFLDDRIVVKIINRKADSD